MEGFISNWGGGGASWGGGIGFDGGVFEKNCWIGGVASPQQWETLTYEEGKVFNFDKNNWTIR